MIRNFKIYSLLAAIMVMFIGCVDDTRFDVPQIGDGDALLMVTVNYDFDADVALKSRAADYNGGDKGDIIERINTLYMVVYNEDGALIRNYKVIGPDGIDDHDYEIRDIVNQQWDNRTDEEKTPDDENPDRPLNDIRTGRVTYSVALPSARYYIYAVANVADFDQYDISTRDKLKSIQFRWDENTTENNSQMFGIYSLGEYSNRNTDDSAPIVVPPQQAKLHCWVRRLASKVTVAFDGSQLYDNVQIYITDIQIHDIPRQCYLGKPNKAGILPDGTEADVSRLHDDTFDNGVIKDGKSILIQELTDSKEILPSNYYHVCNSQHTYLGKGDDGSDDPSVIDNTHTPEAQSLFFYENMQGTGKSKSQTNPEGSSNEIWYPDPIHGDVGSGWKDQKTWGTYIEVTGYYRCNANSQHISSGKIKYRFMLGQDVDKDYNAIRNTHYKLTLVFKGFGNDYDWHIDYEDNPGLHIASPQYISYLYNQQMYITVKIKGKLPDDAYLLGEVDNCTSWKPWGDKDGKIDAEQFPSVDNADYWKGAVYNDGPWHSFLSLCKTNITKVTPPGKENAPSYDLTFPTKLNQELWEKEYEPGASQGSRIYETKEGSYGSNEIGGIGRYTVRYIKDARTNKIVETVFSIPLHTRPKELLTSTGYTGNNPYWEYPRHGKVNFRIVTADKQTYPNFDPVSIDVIQVRRILNPKGVWRKSGSTEPFHVRLKHLRNEDPNYSDFNSIGPWSAEVIKDNTQMITLSSTVEGSGDLKPQYGTNRIEGADEHPIDFNINFSGTDGCAIIRIKYHNYTCEHDIFVREGYEPIQLTDNGAEWLCFNVLRVDANGNAIMTKSPLQEGSMFRRYSNDAIAASNCKRPGFGYAESPAGQAFEVYKKGDATLSTTTSLNQTSVWSNLVGSSPDVTGYMTDADGHGINIYTWDFNNSGEKIPEGTDYYDLIAPLASENTFPIEKGYGVLYGDGATETLSTKKLAEGYDEENGGDSSKGMLGVFVYNSNNGNQIFFPIGQTGYGRRKGSIPTAWMDEGKEGLLRYAIRFEPYSTKSSGNIPNVPLFEDLYERPGAIYWCRSLYHPFPKISSPEVEKSYDDASKCSAFDMNFFTMGFQGFNNDAIRENTLTASDACFIRMIKKK